MVKRCPGCGQEKTLTFFGIRRRSPTGRRSWCRSCEAAQQRARYHDRLAAGLCIDCGQRPIVCAKVLCTQCLAERAEQRAARKASGRCYKCGADVQAGRAHCGSCLARFWVRFLAKKRGITEAEYSALLAQQGRRCAICGQQCATGRRLAVDHDHQTGRVRGLLCFRCNTSLARYEEYTSQFAAYLGGANIA